MSNGDPMVWRDVQMCDSGHEIELITDGHRAWAATNSDDATRIEREGNVVTVYCPGISGGDYICDDPARFDLSKDAEWGEGWHDPSPEERRLLDLSTTVGLDAKR